MKKLFIMFAIVGIGFATPHTAQAQISINIGLQPIWGPVGYDHVDNYYIPDMDAYYNVSNRNYYYNDGGRWVNSPNLPPRYSNFDIYHAHKVVVNEPQPWMHNDRYRKQYSSYRGKHDQTIIRDSREQRYYENPGHPMHNQWHGNGHDQRPGDAHVNPGRGNDHGNQGHGNDHGNQGRGNDHGNQGHGNDHGHEDHGNGHGGDHGHK